MTNRAEIERLLQMTGRTLEGLPERHSDEEKFEAATRKGEWCEIVCHQSDVIELLIGALRDAIEKHPKWISVEERLPEQYQHVIVYVQHTAKWVGATKREERWHVVEEDCWLGDGWEVNADDDIHEITHWMPLPEPPEE